MTMNLSLIVQRIQSMWFFELFLRFIARVIYSTVSPILTTVLITRSGSIWIGQNGNDICTIRMIIIITVIMQMNLKKSSPISDPCDRLFSIELRQKKKKKNGYPL